MKRLLAVMLFLFLLAGCSSVDSELDQAMSIRNQLLSSNGCQFQALITADYGETIYTFSMDCHADKQGNLTFTVTQPETIAGITGSISQSGGKLTFDDQALAFELLADGQVTPVSAPWLLIKTLRGGYLSACGKDGDGLRIAITDSYAQDALQLDIWTDAQNVPSRGEILWQGRRILSLQIENFQYL